MNVPKIDPCLYLIVDPAQCTHHDPAAVAAAAVRGGVTLIQYRNKHAGARALIADLKLVQAAVRDSGVPVLVNDRVDVALAANAQGVHLGQDDMPADIARRLLGANAVIGATIRSGKEADSTALEVVDYVGIGGVFATASKQQLNAPIGVDGFADLAARIRRRRPELALVAISGITAATAPQLMAAGAGGIAVISSICSDRDPQQAASRLRAAIDNATA
ncbi:MAG: thiamine phosphate synthase [Gammaproteobacteria bacterium]|nr:thiamine phosphate synthase [Gammaproteobacteria bacterium]MDH3467865.1 thiamine phosphate synthase [Gammaproteobacteria bacterium]